MDVLEPFVSRVIKAVKNEKYYDREYRIAKQVSRLTGILYIEKGEKKEEHIRITFLLREFHAHTLSDINYLCRYPPAMNIKEQLNLETLPAIHFRKLS